MRINPYLKLDEIVAPNSYVVSPSEEDLDYIVHFRQVCRRYQIDFAKADEDERDFVIRMAEKTFIQKGA